MNKENTEKLWKDFPKLYQGRKKPITENLMAFGFECADGWFKLIYDLSKELSEIAPDTVATQVKEKFGGLNFYVDRCNNEGYDVIDNAETLSYKTCEVCGKPGTQTRGGWIRTLCDKCRQKIEI